MPNLIWFEWEKCPDGYTIEELKREHIRPGEKDVAIPSDVAPTWVHEMLDDWSGVPASYFSFRIPNHIFVPKSTRISRFRPLDESSAAFMELGKCCDTSGDLVPENALKFVNRFGFPRIQFPLVHDKYSRFFDVGEFRGSAGEMNLVIQMWEKSKETSDFRELIAAFNHKDGLRREWQAYAQVEVLLRPTVGPPSLCIVPDDLDSALWLQFAQAVSNNTHLQRCSICPAWFTYGTGTGRRKSAQYCSPKCSKAAYRRRKAES
jgi:hypothetical protein